MGAVEPISEVLTRRWGMVRPRPEPLAGGMNSETWRVAHDGASYVAKRVAPDGLADLVRGCEVATTLAGAGLRTGPPVPTLDGDLVATVERTALLERVVGEPLTGDTPAEQRAMARTLAAVHRAGGPAPGPGTTGWAAWLRPDAPGVADVPWLTPLLAPLRAVTDGLPLTWSLVHTDPEPGAFLHDADADGDGGGAGTTGLVDWSGAGPGPVLYDVASAVMYLGGPQHAGAFLTTYAEQGPLGPDELAHLDDLRRLRWLVQAVYFAGRVHAGDLTGIADPGGNDTGLEDARRGLASLGVQVVGPPGPSRRSRRGPGA